MIFLVIGKTCSGKTYFREYIRKKEAITTYEASDYIRNAKNKYKINSTRNLLKKLGEDYVAREIYSAMTDNNLLDNNVVISGFRTLAEVDYISDKVGQEMCKIIIVDANNILCYLRNIKRNREDKKSKFKDFNKKQVEDTKLGFNKIVNNYPAIYIKNNLTRKNYESNIDKLIEQIIQETTHDEIKQE